MSRLRPFGENPDRQYRGIDLDTLTGHLEELIREEEDRGDIGAHHRTRRGWRLSRAYDALVALTDVSEA